MKTAIRAGGLWCSMVAVLVAGSLVFAQDAKKPEGKGPGKKVQNRLPANYGKLNLSDEQKSKIYAVQAANKPKIDDLMAQLKALKEKEQEEIDAFLTPDQLKQLNEIRAAAKQKQAPEKGKPTDKKVEAGAAPEKKPEGDKKPAPDKK